MANDAKTQKNTQEQSIEHKYIMMMKAELSLLDVKELYDLAYAEKAKEQQDGEAFKKILAEAVKLDMLYRSQLAKAASYKDKTKVKNFTSASAAEKVA